VSILEHYRCPEEIPEFGLKGNPNSSKGFFRFGPNAVCYGEVAGVVRPYVNGNLFDASRAVQLRAGSVELPFDADAVLDNLRYERYVTSNAGWLDADWAKEAYYTVRPMLPVSLRKHLQRIYLRGWQSQSFPGWPVDRSADVIAEQLMVLTLRALRKDRMPFIWFWPEGHKACAILTHDVETRFGRDLTGKLMDVDENYGIQASIQIVPEKRYSVPTAFLDMIRDRGFEINVHGLDHDGNLFRDRAAFLEDAKRINEYAASYQARGFRSPTMYRNVDWFQDLNFSYDMSIPSVARLEPQRGGCCTVMPYFLPGGMLELPLTTTQDYTLFHVLNDYSMALWKQQIDLIVSKNGLVSVIVHPDYVFSDRAQVIYRDLLHEITSLKSRENVWLTLPGKVDEWWRQRRAMKLVSTDGGWKIEGVGSERARVAYACLDGDQLIYEVPN
jgi:hypothetical protein